MFQLAVITQEMSNIETSDTSSSSVASMNSDQDDDEPLNGLDMLLLPDIATTDRTTGGKHSQRSRRRCSLEVSDDEDDDDIPNSYEPLKPNRPAFAANPSPSMPMMMMQRPNSLRDTTSTTATTTSIQKPVLGLQQRNTCGTLYIGSTMSAPDTDATIQCVCGVVRAHILQSERDGDDMDDDNTHKKYNIFNDQESLQHRHKKSNMHQYQKRISTILQPLPIPSRSLPKTRFYDSSTSDRPVPPRNLYLLSRCLSTSQNGNGLHHHLAHIRGAAHQKHQRCDSTENHQLAFHSIQLHGTGQ
jgi:hypothetical protein